MFSCLWINDGDHLLLVATFFHTSGPCPVLSLLTLAQLPQRLMGVGDVTYLAGWIAWQLSAHDSEWTTWVWIPALGLWASHLSSLSLSFPIYEREENRRIKWDHTYKRFGLAWGEHSGDGRFCCSTSSWCAHGVGFLNECGKRLVIRNRCRVIHWSNTCWVPLHARHCSRL